MKILITRPKQQAEALASVLAQRKLESICFPVLDVNCLSLNIGLASIEACDSFIFVSPAAVNCFFKQHEGFVIAPQQTIFAMGVGTEEALSHFSRHPVIVANPANSEGMLALAELQTVANKKIAIFAGVNGKTLLANTLQEHAADIQKVYTHERVLPQYSLPLAWSVDEVAATIVISLQSLENLQLLIESLNLQALYTKTLIVITDEMRAQAEQLGFEDTIYIAAGADHASLRLAVQAVLG